MIYQDEREPGLPPDSRRGRPAPDFSLTDEEGREWRLSEKRGRVVTLLFYPRDETLVCTKQLCSVRDRWAEYLATGAEIVGISPDSVESHREFARSHQLPIRLLADAGREVTSLYGLHRWMPVWSTRAVVIVDAQGIVRHRKVMLRAFRPNDGDVLAAIYSAKNDVYVAARTVLVERLRQG